MREWKYKINRKQNGTAKNAYLLRLRAGTCLHAIFTKRRLTMAAELAWRFKWITGNYIRLPAVNLISSIERRVNAVKTRFGTRARANEIIKKTNTVSNTKFRERFQRTNVLLMKRENLIVSGIYRVTVVRRTDRVYTAVAAEWKNYWTTFPRRKRFSSKQRCVKQQFSVFKFF